jgi:hypothetical protein
MKKQFIEDKLMARKIWETMMLSNDAYKTCQELGKCSPDPEVGPSECHGAFLDKGCMMNPQCKNMTEFCTEECYTCNWLVKGWPLFQEICKPDGATLPQSVPLPGDTSSLLQFRERAARFRSAKRKRLGTRMEATDTAMNPATGGGGGGGGGGPAQQTQLMTGYTLTETCFSLWQEIKNSMKFRYFTSWKRDVSIMTTPLDRLAGIMWDANIVCKCMGKCDLGRFEDLGMLDQCRYGEQEDQMMRFIYRYEGDPMTEFVPKDNAQAAAKAAPPNKSGKTPPPVAFMRPATAPVQT